jgi:hypothetical protein
LTWNPFKPIKKDSRRIIFRSKDGAIDTGRKKEIEEKKL